MQKVRHLSPNLKQMILNIYVELENMKRNKKYFLGDMIA